MRVDLHIHSALSPCASDDMTPHNIVNMAKLCGSEMISVCDHNTLGQQRMMAEVAQKLNITEEELMSYYNLPKKYIKYKNNEWAFKLGIKLYTILGLDKRIRQ